MLVKPFLTIITLTLFYSPVCSATSAQKPLLGSGSERILLESSFCKKYKCRKIASGSLTSSWMLYMPGNKWSGQLKSPKNQVTAEFKLTSGRITTGIVNLDKNYPDGGIPGEYVELADDFIQALTGRYVFQNKEYFHGGEFDSCIQDLYEGRISGSNVMEKDVYMLSNKTIDGRNFSASCWQSSGKVNEKALRRVIVRLK